MSAVMAPRARQGSDVIACAWYEGAHVKRVSNIVAAIRRKPKQMTDFFKPMTAKQSPAADDGFEEKPTAAGPVLQTMPNGQPRHGSASVVQHPKAPPAGKQPRRPPQRAGAIGSNQPDAKRQRTLGGTPSSQAVRHQQQPQRQQQIEQASRPPPPSASIIDITLSDATGMSREPAAAMDEAAGEVVSSSQRTERGVAASAIAPDPAQHSVLQHEDGTGSRSKLPVAGPRASERIAGNARGESVRYEGLGDTSGPHETESDPGVASLEALGFGRLRARAALLKCGNDVERAANLLCSTMA